MRALEQDSVKRAAAMIATHGVYNQWLNGVVVVNLCRPALRANELDDGGSQHAARGHGKDSNNPARILKTRAKRSKPTTPVDVLSALWHEDIYAPHAAGSASIFTFP
jgi:hypothetical protein